MKLITSLLIVLACILCCSWNTEEDWMKECTKMCKSVGGVKIFSVDKYKTAQQTRYEVAPNCACWGQKWKQQ